MALGVSHYVAVPRPSEYLQLACGWNGLRTNSTFGGKESPAEASTSSHSSDRLMPGTGCVTRSLYYRNVLFSLPCDDPLFFTSPPVHEKLWCKADFYQRLFWRWGVLYNCRKSTMENSMGAPREIKTGTAIGASNPTLT